MNKPAGKYVYYREIYLQEEKPKYYAELVKSGTLNEHLDSINKQAHELKDRIVEKLKKESPEWQQLVETADNDFFKQVRLRNQFDSIADEYVYQDIIYA